MEQLKTAFGKLMNFFMLSCEEATSLMTKKKYQKIPFIKGMQLKMHLLSCKLCRRFDIHNDLIHQEWKQFNDTDFTLTEKTKEKITRKIESEIVE